MPDFLSRLVKRTFGLIPVAQPVTDSVFAPMPAIESDYIQGLAHDSEPVRSQENIPIESARETGIIPQHDGQPVVKKSINRIPDKQLVQEQYVESNFRDKDVVKPSNQIDYMDSRCDLTSISRLPHNIELPGQNGTTNLAQDEEQFHDIELDSKGHIEPEQKDFADVQETGIISQHDDQPALRKSITIIPDKLLGPGQYVESGSHDKDGAKPSIQIKDRNSQGDLTSISRLPHNIELPRQNGTTNLSQDEEQFHDIEPDSLIYDKEPPQSPETSYLERDGSKPSHPVDILKNRNVDQSGFRREPKLPYENLSAGKNPGKSRQNEPLIDNIYSSIDKTLPGHISDSSQLHESLSYQPDDLHPDAHSSSIIATKKNQTRVNNPRVNVTLEQMGNKLIDQYAVASRPPTTVPTIKVNIGRIEVKAVTQPQAPQPQTSPPKQHPVLSLDDYLKQYNG